MPPKKTVIILLWALIAGVYAKSQTSNDIDSLVNAAASQTDSVKVMTYLKIGQLYNRKGLIDSAERYFNLLLAYGEEKKDNKKICLANLSLGGIEIHRDRLDRSLNFFFRAATIADKEHFGKYKVDADLGIGYIYQIQKRDSDALKCYLDAESVLLKQPVIDTMYLVNAYASLTDCAGTMGDTLKAMSYYNKGAVLCELYEVANHDNKSKTEYLNARWLSLIYNATNYLVSKKEIEVTVGHMMRMLNNIKEAGNEFQLFKAYNIIADLNLKLGRYKEALQYGEAALQIFPEKDHGNNFKDIYWTVSEAAAALKQYEKAYRSLSKVKVYNDSIYNQVKMEEVNSIQARYEADKKEIRIETLNKEKRFQRILFILAAAALVVTLGLLVFVIRSKKLKEKLLLREKEAERTQMEHKMTELEQTALRAQMNPHFIFNCLNSVQRFVIGRDAEGANHYLSTFASLIRQTLENSGKTLIPLKDEIQYLDTYIKMEQLRSNHGFDYEINVQPDIDTSDVFIPNMIIQPFVENSILHGVTASARGKGRIRLAFSREDKLVCMLDDNGPGIRTTAETTSVNPAAHVPMGSSITEKRIGIYNTVHPEKIELKVTDRKKSGEDESGTRIVIRFPLTN